MRLRTFSQAIVGLYLLTGFGGGTIWSQEFQEKKAIANCLTLIRNCQLADGAFRTKADGDPVWIQPYCANHAALALLAGKNQADRPRVLKWLNWYADHQQADGTIDDYEGGMSGGYHSNGKRDSVDSYAAMFLLVADRYRVVTGNVPPQLKKAARKAFAALQSVTDDDGLTWSKPDYRVKYLMDNLEVYGGLSVSSQFFQAVGDQPTAETAEQMRQKLARKLTEYWRQDEKLFAYALDERRHYVTKPEKESQRRESEGLGNLFALAWLSTRDLAPWTHVNQQFQPDGGNSPEAPIERWYMAATRILPLQSNELKDWKSRTVNEALSFTPKNVYLHRLAVTALALEEGAAWLPNQVIVDERR